MLPSFPTIILQISVLITFASTQRSSCLLPSHPDSGQWSLVSAIPKTTTRVPHLTILRVSCLPSHKLDGCTVTVCMNGQWVPPIGTCLKTCPSISSTATLQVTCLYKEQERRNCTKPLEGSIAKFKCESYYEDLRLIRANAVCNNGKWSEDIPECTPICGKAVIEPEPTLIISGVRAKKGQFPWQVALYTVDDEVLNCGGTLLSERIIVSAAHCITDTDGVLMDKANFLAVAGKHYRKLHHQEDLEFAQSSEIRDMFIPEYYEGELQNYLGDISILITKEYFTFSPRIQPACIDWNKKYAERLLRLNIHGYVSGWGYTKTTKDPSDELKHLKVPIIPTRECKRIAEDQYKDYVTLDKFCAGFKDNGTSVCSGDSGGGLVFRHGTRYYLTGIVSLAPRLLEGAGGCNSDEYGLYTLVYNYTDDFILRAIAKYKPSAELPDENIKPTTSTTLAPPRPTSQPSPKGACKIPQISNGKFTIFGTSPLKENVPDNTVISLKCDNGFSQQGTNVSLCSKGIWTSLGSCARLCPPLLPVNHINIKCHLHGTPSDCAQAVENTVAQIECDLYYELLSLNTKPLLCLDGVWSNPLPRCVPSCGKGDAKLAPWLARISRKSESGIQEICMGSLISPGTLVTAAHCFTDESGHFKNSSEFLVSVGFPESYTQRAKIKMVQISPEYKGMVLNYYKDFAKVTLEKELYLSERVHPVCVHWAETVPSTSTDVVLIGRKDDTITIKTLQRFTIEECYKYTTSPQQVYLTSGKFCAIPTMNSTLCVGDGGSGILEKYQGRYYLLGVASLLLDRDPLTICSSGTLIYTDIRGHIEELL